jgi:membrane protease YdiL (CAAX protease family)
MLYLVLAAAAASVLTAIAVHEYLLEVPVVIGGGFVLTNYVRRAGAREEVVILIAGWA